MIGDRQRLFDCHCHSHKIEVDVECEDDDNALVWFVFWERAGCGDADSGRNRLKRAWGSLRGRDSGVCSEVLLTRSDARRLGYTLIQLAPDPEFLRLLAEEAQIEAATRAAAVPRTDDKGAGPRQDNEEKL